MAFGSSTVTNLGGAVADLFAGFAAKEQARLKAQGLDITAMGTAISAQGITQQAAGLRIKAAGDVAEAERYDIAAGLARKNEEYTRESTAIQQMQLERSIQGTMGEARAAIGASGLKESGSAIDVLTDSAKQGALAHDVLARQGEITEAGYEEQAKSYDVMAATARMAASGERSIADATDVIAGETARISVYQHDLAAATLAAGDEQAKGDFIGAAFKGAAAVVSMFA